MTLIERLNCYEQLMRLNKPIGILLLLWPTLWALWLSSYGSPLPAMVMIFVLGVVLMRSAGCVINDLADRNYDPYVERTRGRPLAAKRISAKEALLLAFVLVFLAFLLVWQLNALTLKLSVIALVLAIVYPFLKRFFWLPQAWLGIAFGFGIPMAFAAQLDQVPRIAWILLLANVFWAIAYDTEYAMMDKEEDKKLGLKSSAILFGRYDVVGVMACHAAFLATMIYGGYLMHMRMFYYVGLALAAMLIANQYLQLRTGKREAFFKAFMNNNLVGGVIFLGIILNDLIPW